MKSTTGASYQARRVALGRRVRQAHAQVRAVGGAQHQRPLRLGRRLEQLDQGRGLVGHRQAEARVGVAAALQEVAHDDQQLQGDQSRDDDQQQAGAEAEADHEGSAFTGCTNR